MATLSVLRLFSSFWPWYGKIIACISYLFYYSLIFGFCSYVATKGQNGPAAPKGKEMSYMIYHNINKPSNGIIFWVGYLVVIRLTPIVIYRGWVRAEDYHPGFSLFLEAPEQTDRLPRAEQPDLRRHPVHTADHCVWVDHPGKDGEDLTGAGRRARDHHGVHGAVPEQWRKLDVHQQLQDRQRGEVINTPSLSETYLWILHIKAHQSLEKHILTMNSTKAK